MFGDPEFILPDKKYDLIVLCMVCHCFAYPFRALGNLINYSSSSSTQFLFIHRTDDFMKAVSAIDPGKGATDTAKCMWNLWQKEEIEHKVPYQYRFICEHEWLAHQMKLNRYHLKSSIEATFNDDTSPRTKREILSQVIKEKRYTPLNYFKGVIEETNLSNEEIKLSLYLYNKDNAGHTNTLFQFEELINSVCTVPFYLPDLDISIDPLAEENNQFRSEAKQWFHNKTSIFEAELSLPYGFYVDTRRKRKHKIPRYQLWPDSDLGHIVTDDSISLLKALSALDSWKKRNFWVLIWIVLPNLRFWYDNYVYMPGVLDSDEKLWSIIPFVKSNSGDSDQSFIQILKALGNIGGHDEIGLGLAKYLRTLVDVLIKKDVIATYYMVFREPHSDENKPIAFSVQSTRWLDVTEVRSLAHTARSALAAINWNLTARQNAESEILKKHSQMLDLLQSPLESLTTLLNKTQEDAQTLRSILYEPRRSLFAVASQVKKYFDENRQVSFGNVQWNSIHDPKQMNYNYSSCEVILNTIAAIICEIFGKSDIKIQNKNELYGVANNLLQNNEETFKYTRDLLISAILRFNKLPEENNIENYRKLILAFTAFKTILFTPYKDGIISHPILPLLVIIYDANTSCNITIDRRQTEIISLAIIKAENRVSAFKRTRLPVPRYSALLSLISGLITYGKNQTGINLKHVIINIKEKNIIISFTDNVFNLFQIKESETFEKIKTIVEEGNMPLFVGNFHKPFFDFARMCISKNSKVIFDDIVYDKLTILSLGGSVTICIKQNGFEIRMANYD